MQTTMLMPVVIIFALSAGAGLWLFYALPQALGLTIGLIGLCQSFFVKCAAYLDFIKLLCLWSGALLVFAGLLFALVRAAASVIKAGRALRRLPLKDNGSSVVLINDAALNAAFTSGLFFPRIYISKGLFKNLDREELMAVFFHELHHKRRFDPLRFFLIGFLRDAFFYVPAAGYLIGRIRLEKELEADDAACAAMKEPISLAGALVKAGRFNALALNHGATHLTGGVPGGTIEARVKRLVEGAPRRGAQIKFAAPRPAPVIASLLVAGFMVVSFTMSFNGGGPGANISRECTERHCTRHINRLGKDCKTHCAAPQHGH